MSASTATGYRPVAGSATFRRKSVPSRPTATPIAAPPASCQATCADDQQRRRPVPGVLAEQGDAEHGQRVVQAGLALEHAAEQRGQRQPAQHGEDGGRVGRREHGAEQQRLPPAEAEHPVRARGDHPDADGDTDGGQQHRGRRGPPGVLPVGGQAALGEDQHEGTEAEGLGEPRVVEPDADAVLAEREAEPEEDEQRGQAKAVRQPGRHDGRDDRGRRRPAGTVRARPPSQR